MFLDDSKLVECSCFLFPDISVSYRSYFPGTEQILQRRRLIGSLPFKDDDDFRFAVPSIEVDGSMPPDISNVFPCLVYQHHPENYRSVLLRYNLLTRTCVPFPILDNLGLQTPEFRCHKNNFLLAVLKMNGIELVVFNLSTRKIRRMHLKSLQDVLEDHSLSWTWISTLPNFIRLCHFFPESRAVRVLAYEPKSQSGLN